MLLICAAGVCAHAQESDSLLVIFWNLENFFDWRDQGTGESDCEFSSRGSGLGPNPGFILNAILFPSLFSGYLIGMERCRML